MNLQRSSVQKQKLIPEMFSVTVHSSLQFMTCLLCAQIHSGISHPSRQIRHIQWKGNRVRPKQNGKLKI